MSNSIRLRKEMGIARPGLDSSPGSVSEMVNYGTNSSLWGLPWENSLSPESGEKIPIVVSASHSSSPWQSALKQNQGEKDWKQKGKVLLVFFCGFFFFCVFSFFFFVHGTESINSLDCFQKRNPERLLLFLSILLLHQLHPLQPASGQDMS